MWLRLKRFFLATDETLMEHRLKRGWAGWNPTAMLGAWLLAEK
jgi:hypothetical protein